MITIFSRIFLIWMLWLLSSLLSLTSRPYEYFPRILESEETESEETDREHIQMKAQKKKKKKNVRHRLYSLLLRWVQCWNTLVLCEWWRSAHNSMFGSPRQRHSRTWRDRICVTINCYRRVSRCFACRFVYVEKRHFEHEHHATKRVHDMHS